MKNPVTVALSLLTVAQAAAQLNISARRVQAIIAAGNLKATQVGARLLTIAARDLEAYEAQRPPKRGGRKPILTKCTRCGKIQPSARIAWVHCRDLDTVRVRVNGRPINGS